MGSDVVYNKKTARKIGWAMVLLSVLIVVGGMFFATSDSGDNSIVHPVTDASLMQFAASDIQNAKVGTNFTLSLTVHNGANKAQQISEITITNAFMGNGLLFVSGQPEMKKLSVVDGGVKYSLIQPVMPFDTSPVEIQFSAKRAGTYSGEIQVCFLSGVCTKNTIHTTVVP
jgi:hypothetical protein